MKCSVCGLELTGRLDTFGIMGLPACLGCWYVQASAEDREPFVMGMTAWALENITAPIQTIVNTLQAFTTSLVDVAERTMSAIALPLKGIEDALYIEYKKAGAPYGKRRRGMWRWVKELRKGDESGEV